MVNLLELYKKEIEVFLATMGIYRSDKVINERAEMDDRNREFIKKQMLKIFAGNLDIDLLNKAIDELLPYLYEVN